MILKTKDGRMISTGIILKVDVLEGADNNSIANSMCALAEQLCVVVEANIDGVPMMAQPGQSPADVILTWQGAKEWADAEVRAKEQK